jgi:hypothetical protein
VCAWSCIDAVRSLTSPSFACARSGKWVQTTHGPTPLGVLFHNTDLNHVGYSLDRKSVPLCEGVNATAERACLLRHKAQFAWENRDFNVDPAAVLQYVEHVVLAGREREVPCEELQENLSERFVLYNVWCSKPWRWYPGFERGEKTCRYGADYPLDHTAVVARVILHATRGGCCAAFPVACRAGSEGEREGAPGHSTALFHAYRTLPVGGAA